MENTLPGSIPEYSNDQNALYGAWLIFWIVVAVLLVVLLSVSTGVTYRFYRKERRTRKRLESNCFVESSYSQVSQKKATIQGSDVCRVECSRKDLGCVNGYKFVTSDSGGCPPPEKSSEPSLGYMFGGNE
jgi:hypothetical protein